MIIYFLIPISLALYGPLM